METITQHNTIIEALPELVTITGDWETKKVTLDGKILRPERSQKIWNHSPDGFNWSYGGSGPAQLSLAILLMYLPKKDAVRLHQSFKFKFIAELPSTDFSVQLKLKEKIKKIY